MTSAAFSLKLLKKTLSNCVGNISAANGAAVRCSVCAKKRNSIFEQCCSGDTSYQHELQKPSTGMGKRPVPHELPQNGKFPFFTLPM